jgi:hypothetical protein
MKRNGILKMALVASFMMVMIAGADKALNSASLDLASRMLPVPREAFFQDDGWFTWEGSMIQGDDGRYDL